MVTSARTKQLYADLQHTEQAQLLTLAHELASNGTQKRKFENLNQKVSEPKNKKESRTLSALAFSPDPESN